LDSISSAALVKNAPTGGKYVFNNEKVVTASDAMHHNQTNLDSDTHFNEQDEEEETSAEETSEQQ